MNDGVVCCLCKLVDEGYLKQCLRVALTSGESPAYAPGGKSLAHHHAGSVMAYVMEGAIRSQLKGGDVRVYHAGESFFEPPGSVHVVGENASTTEPAKLLAIFVAPEGAELTVDEK